MVNIGNNKFESVTFPLAIENRYFMLESSNGTDVWTVFYHERRKTHHRDIEKQPSRQ